MINDQIDEISQKSQEKQSVYELSIQSTKVLIGETGFKNAIVCIKSGKIMKIEIDASEQTIEQTKLESVNFIDYGDKVIMSGVIDMNVSLHANYQDEEWTQIQNLTKIALAGGVTMVVNNPLLENNENIVELNQNLSECRQKIQAMLQSSYVDFAQLALLTKTNYKSIYDQQQMQQLRKSIIGFRTYFSPSLQPEVDYYSNKLQIMQFIDSLKDVDDLCIFVHPIYLQNEKELGVTSPLRNQQIQSRIEIESNVDILNERTVPSADAVLGETTKEEKWSSVELEPLRNNKIQQKLLKIFPMAQQKTMQSALKLLSIQEKRQYLCSVQNILTGENYKSEEGEQNQENEDRYLEFKKLNDTKHSFLSIESEDEALNKYQSQINASDTSQMIKDANSVKIIEYMRSVSICLDSSKQITQQVVDNNQSQEELTETGSRTTNKNSVSPQKDQQANKQVHSQRLSILKQNSTEKNEVKKQLESNQKINIPLRNQQQDEQNEDSPSSASVQNIRPKSHSNLLIRRKLQIQKTDHLLPPSQGSLRKVNFLIHSNSNLQLPTGSEIGSSDAVNSVQNLPNQALHIPNQNIFNKNSDSENKIEEEDDNGSERQINTGGGYNRVRSQTSSFMLNTKLKSKNLEMQQKIRRDYLNFLTFRPPFWENIALNFFKLKFIEYQQNKIDFKPTLVFTNISNSYSVAKIFRQKLSNPHFKLYLEISSPFLYFDSSSIKEGETKFKNEPAIYDKLNKKLLLTELEVDSVVDCVGSNHFYVPPKYKPSDFTRAFNGLNSIGSNLYSLWTLSWINLKRKFQQNNIQNSHNFKNKEPSTNLIRRDSKIDQSGEDQKLINNEIREKELPSQYYNENNEIQIQSNNKDQTLKTKGTYEEGENSKINENKQICDVKQGDENIDSNESNEINQKKNKLNYKQRQNSYESQEKRIEKKILELSKLLSINPAKILGISDQKGQIKLGLDADFVVWDPFEQIKFSVDKFQSSPEIAPLHIFDRKNFYGRIYATIIRGNILYFQSQNNVRQHHHSQKQVSNIIMDDSTEKLSPYLKKKQNVVNPHNFVSKDSFQAKLITKS